MLKIYGTQNSRAMRPIWTAEEMGLEYELIMMPFPPRVFHKEYLEINMLGTVPYLTDGDIKMTESVAMAQYLVCLLYTSPSPRDRTRSRMPSSA